jgi:hypothetical protein
MSSNSIFFEIDSREKLFSFLKENPNSYNDFILQKSKIRRINFK